MKHKKEGKGPTAPSSKNASPSGARSSLNQNQPDSPNSSSSRNGSPPPKCHQSCFKVEEPTKIFQPVSNSASVHSPSSQSVSSLNAHEYNSHYYEELSNGIPQAPPSSHNPISSVSQLTLQNLKNCLAQTQSLQQEHQPSPYPYTNPPSYFPQQQDPNNIKPPPSYYQSMSQGLCNNGHDPYGLPPSQEMAFDPFGTQGEDQQSAPPNFNPYSQLDMSHESYALPGYQSYYDYSACGNSGNGNHSAMTHLWPPFRSEFSLSSVGSSDLSTTSLTTTDSTNYSSDLGDEGVTTLVNL